MTTPLTTPLTTAQVSIRAESTRTGHKPFVPIRAECSCRRVVPVRHECERFRSGEMIFGNFVSVSFVTTGRKTIVSSELYCKLCFVIRYTSIGCFLEYIGQLHDLALEVEETSTC